MDKVFLKLKSKIVNIGIGNRQQLTEGGKTGTNTGISGGLAGVPCDANDFYTSRFSVLPTDLLV